MEFLPLNVKMESVYAGLSPRLGALAIDLAVQYPFWLLANWYDDSPWRLLNFGTDIIPIVILLAYNICCHALWGQTLGKRAFNIQVALPDGSRIGAAQAWQRELPNLILGAAIALQLVLAYRSLDMTRYLTMTSNQRDLELSNALSPILWMIPLAWFALEGALVLGSERHRTIHDRIGGTAVIMKKFVGYVPPPPVPVETPEIVSLPNGASSGPISAPPAGISLPDDGIPRQP